MNLLNKPKVLLIPAWYPASFFTEQMRLVEDAFDFKVLTGKRTKLGKKRAAFKILHGKFTFFSWIENKSTHDSQADIHISYSYIHFLSRYFEKKQYRFLNEYFENELDKLAKLGWKPDLIHIQSLNDTAVFVCNWAQKNKIPIILTEHIVFVRQDFDFFQMEKESVYSRVNKVLCVSNYVYRNLLINGFNIKDVGVIGNLVEDTFVPALFDKKEITNKKILFVATHLADKDIEVLLKAVKLLIEAGFVDIKVDVLGIDPHQFYNNDCKDNYLLKEEINKLGLSAYFDIKGILSSEDLLKSYKDYSIFVSTSFSETFGLAIAEALSNGIPVVITDSGGPRDFVNESNGIIVPIRNPQSLAEAIKEMIKNVSAYNSPHLSNNIIRDYGRKAFSKIISEEYIQQIKGNGY